MSGHIINAGRLHKHSYAYPSFISSSSSCNDCLVTLQEAEWIGAEEYLAAEPDPLREVAAGIVDDFNVENYQDLRRFPYAFGGLTDLEVRESSKMLNQCGVRIAGSEGHQSDKQLSVFRLDLMESHVIKKHVQAQCESKCKCGQWRNST